MRYVILFHLAAGAITRKVEEIGMYGFELKKADRPPVVVFQNLNSGLLVSNDL